MAVHTFQWHKNGSLQQVSNDRCFGRPVRSFASRLKQLNRPSRQQDLHIVRCEKKSETLTEEIQSGLDEQARRDKYQKKQTSKYKEHNDQIQALAEKVQKGLQGTSIYLVGMMGSGKTTVGKLVAGALQYPFLDVDSLTEQTSQMKISDIFANEGEESFRDLETATLKELMAFRSTVVSTGGGAVLRRVNWGYMQHAVVVWLQGSPELLAHRAIKDDVAQRPLLKPNEDTNEESTALSEEEQYEQIRQKLEDILKDREEKYAQADITVPLHDSNGGATGANAGLVTYRVLKAIHDRIQGDRKEEPTKEKPFKGFGTPPKSKQK